MVESSCRPPTPSKPLNPLNPSPPKAIDRLNDRLESSGPVILPALLLCDFGHLAREVEALEKAGAAGLHLDIMDGQFVPQLTYGLVVVEAVRRTTALPLEVHLMIQDPERSLADYALAGVDIITVHLESLVEPRKTLEMIRSLGPNAHLAISPRTPVQQAVPFLDCCDGVLVMSVEPGYGGQAFEPDSLLKLAELSKLRDGGAGTFRLCIDGGMSTHTVGPAAAAGAELIVAGSAVIRSSSYADAIAHLEQLARNAA